MKRKVMKNFNARAALPVRPIATKAELLDRLRQRDKPKVERALEPAGTTRMAVNANQSATNEARIRDLRERLGTAREKLRAGFAKTNVTANLKRDFDRGR